MNGLVQVFDPADIATVLARFQADLHKPAFWLAVGSIIWINVLLSGDNALVIAMACRGLPPRQRLWGMAIGAGIAVVLLVTFTGVVATLMGLPYLKLVSGLALIVIAARLLLPDDESGGVAAGTSLWQAVRIVVIADIIMSLDNVIAVAAAADGQLPLLILGLAISIPMIIAGAALIMMVLDRLPILIWLGALLLGWIAGGVIATDAAIHPFLQRILDGKVAIQLDATSAVFGGSPHIKLDGDAAEYLCSVLGATAVLVAGWIWRTRRLRLAAHSAREGAEEAAQPVEQRPHAVGSDAGGHVA